MILILLDSMSNYAKNPLDLQADMKKPTHQTLITYILWILTGFLALGTFLDAIANAISLITLPVSLAGTVIISVLLICIQIYLSKNPLSWVTNASLVKISKLNLGLLLPVFGMLILLWVPTIFNRIIVSESLAGGALQDSIETFEESKAETLASDNLEISSVSTVEVSTTEIRESAGQGIISAYWEILLSNVGSKQLSVISYKVLQIGEDFPVAWYTDMDQGLYVLKNGEPSKFELPVDISSGNSKKIYIRLGLMMTPEVSELVKEKFSGIISSDTTLRKILRFLYTKGTDFYGNKIETQIIDDTGKIMSRIPSQDELHEQEFVITFTTSRGEKINESLSWYKFGGAYDLMRYQ